MTGGPTPDTAADPTTDSKTDPMTRVTPRIAANPIPYWARDGVVDKSRAVFDEAFADFARIGVTAVKADLPTGMSATEYREWIGPYGLAPAISTVMVPFDEGVDGLSDADGLRRFAGEQLALGNSATMLIPPMTPTRIATPAVAVDHTPAQLESTVANLAAACDLLLSEGLAPAIHQHVGSLIESEHELRTLLGELGPDTLGFAPDTGHLTWAGMDPKSLIAEFGDRVAGLHLKDVFADFLGAAGREHARGLTYHEVGATKRLWAEPGLGVVDLLGAVAAMPADYAGDYMIEVDVPSVDSRYESHRLSYEWARDALPVAG